MARALTVAIQAGGKSSRMGTDKAFVELDGKPLIEHVLDKVRQIDPAQILIITKTPEKYAAYEGVSLIEDNVDRGALGGLFIATYGAERPNILMVACDMPFLNPALLAFIVDMQMKPWYFALEPSLEDRTKLPYLAIVPRWNGYPEGMHALYHKSCRATIQNSVKSNRLSLNSFLEGLSRIGGVHRLPDGSPADSGVRWLDALEYAHLDAEGRSFTNINTPDDLLAAQTKLET